MKKTGLVSIILLNCNGKQFNKDCIDSILLQTYNNYEIIFVNNMSTDGSLEEIQDIYRKEIEKGIIKIVLNPSNTGFTGGNNLGVQNSSKKSEYICLLNNDVTVENDWLKKLVEEIQQDDTLGAIGSIILDKGEEENVKNKIFNENLFSGTNLYSGFVNNKIDDNSFKKQVYYSTFISGCCFLYKKNILDLPFEDYYFIYADDIYLSWRILSLGYNLGLSLNTFVNHYGSGTVGKMNELKLFRLIRNRQINFFVFNPFLFKLFIFPLLILTEIFSLLTGNIIMKIKAEIRAIWWIIMNYKTINKTRKKIHKEQKISNFKFTNLLSHKLIDTYFIKSLGGIYLFLLPIVYVINFVYVTYYYIIRILIFWY